MKTEEIGTGQKVVKLKSNVQKDNKNSHVINVGGGGRGSLLFAFESVKNWEFFCH